MKDGIVFSIWPKERAFPTKLDAEIMAEEIIMRLDEADEDADAG